MVMAYCKTGQAPVSGSIELQVSNLYYRYVTQAFRYKHDNFRLGFLRSFSGNVRKMTLASS